MNAVQIITSVLEQNAIARYNRPDWKNLALNSNGVVDIVHLNLGWGVDYLNLAKACAKTGDCIVTYTPENKSSPEPAISFDEVIRIRREKLEKFTNVLLDIPECENIYFVTSGNAYDKDWMIKSLRRTHNQTFVILG